MDDSFQIFINGIDAGPAVGFPVIEGTTPSRAINVSSNHIADKDIVVTLQPAPDKATYYNQQYHTDYVLLPDTCYKLSGTEVKINAGTALSNSVNMNMISFSSLKKGVTYILPVTISSTTGQYVAESLRTVYYLVNVATKATVVGTKDNYFSVDMSSNNDKLGDMKAATIQMNIYANGFHAMSGLIALGKNSVLRLGDTGIPGNQIQVLGALTNNRAAVMPMLTAGKWYKLAYVFDGTSVKFYIDGKLRFEGPASGSMDLTSDFRIGFDWDDSRSFDGLMSECRIWSKALTADEIISNGCDVDPSSPGLEAYWKFNEGAGDIAVDATGHGHTATANSPLTWIENQTCL
jgi:hypothetical protein